MKFGEKLKQLRGKKTQDEVAKSIGISRARYSHYENERTEPDIELIQRIAEYYKVTTDYLLGRSENKYWELNEKDEKDIQKKLEEIIEDMSKADALSFSKGSEPMSEETRQLLILSLENSLRLGKEMAKKKFTPKKYRNEEE